MGATFIIKRRNYAVPAILATAGKALSGPKVATGLNIGFGVMDAKSTVEDRDDAEEFNYSNNPQQKQYGAIQAIKEVGTGVGKGLYNWGKQNKKSLGGLVGFGAVMGAGTYGMNRIQRQKAEINAGEREANGMSTGGKVVAGATALGTGGLAAYKTGQAHDKALNKATEKLAQDKKILAEANSKGLTKIGDKASKDISAGKEAINKMNKTRLGMSNKTFKVTRNGLLAGGLVAGAGLLANNMLKQKNNSLAAVGRMAKRALNGKSLGQAIKAGEWGNVGRAAGTYITQGTKSLARSGANFFTPGKGGAGRVVKSMEDSLRNQGEYGKKAADFLHKHKTAAGVATAATVGTGVFNATNAIGEKGVNTTANLLDKKTADYVKAKEEGQML